MRRRLEKAAGTAGEESAEEAARRLALAAANEAAMAAIAYSPRKIGLSPAASTAAPPTAPERPHTPLDGVVFPPGPTVPGSVVLLSARPKTSMETGGEPPRRRYYADTLFSSAAATRAPASSGYSKNPPSSGLSPRSRLERRPSWPSRRRRAWEAEARSERAAALANAALTHNTSIDPHSRDSKGSGMVGGWRVAARAEERSVSFGWRMHAEVMEDDIDFYDDPMSDYQSGVYAAGAMYASGAQDDTVVIIEAPASARRVGRSLSFDSRPRRKKRQQRQQSTGE